MDARRQNSGSEKSWDRDRLVGRPFSRDRDLDQVLALYARAFAKEINEPQWSWKYLPPWANRPVAWVAEVGGRIVSHLGAVPLRGQVYREEVMFFLFCDVVVDPEFRSMGIYALLKSGPVLTQLAQEHPRSVIYGFSGEKVGRWYRLLSAGVPAVSVEASLDRIIRQEPATGSGAVGHGEIELTPWRWDSPEIDRLWAKQCDTVLIGLIRDRVYLGWRYGGHPTYDYSLFGVMRRAEAVGWIVTSAVGDTSPPAVDLRVHDFLLPPALRIPVLQQLAAEFDSDAVVAWVAENARPAGIESRANGWQVMHLSLSPSISTEDLARNVYYTLGEADQWWW